MEGGWPASAQDDRGDGGHDDATFVDIDTILPRQTVGADDWGPDGIGVSVRHGLSLCLFLLCRGSQGCCGLLSLPLLAFFFALSFFSGAVVVYPVLALSSKLAHALVANVLPRADMAQYAGSDVVV